MRTPAFRLSTPLGGSSKAMTDALEPGSRQGFSAFDKLASDIKDWTRELGFSAVGIADTDLREAEARLSRWLALGRHGEMHFMHKHGRRRTRPQELVPGTCRIICVRMDYRPAEAAPALSVLQDPRRAYVSRYALGRDYHKLMRRRLQRLAERITTVVGPFGYRAFADSAPVMEKPLAAKAGLGWIGKHTNLLSRDGGSWYFLGELYTDLPLPVDQPVTDHCGSCQACMDVCPTRAIVAPYQLDARRCISYLTIELTGSIPVEFRRAIGNRVFGCDDCQLFCPWNKFAQHSPHEDFKPRHGLDDAALTELFGWDEQTFLARTAGSAIRRIGHVRWLRNLAVALGNAPYSPDILEALTSRCDHPSALVREHVAWAIAEQRAKRASINPTQPSP